MAGRDTDPMPATLNGLNSDTEDEDALGRKEQEEAKGSFHTLHTKRPWEDPTEHLPPGHSRAPPALLPPAGDRALSCRALSHIGDSIGQGPILHHQQKRAAAAILDMDVRDIKDIKDLGGLLQVLNLEEKGKGANRHFPDIFMSDSDEEGEEPLGNTLHRQPEARAEPRTEVRTMDSKPKPVQDSSKDQVKLQNIVSGGVGQKSHGENRSGQPCVPQRILWQRT